MRGGYSLLTESTASNFTPVDRMKRRISGLIGSMFLPQPSIKISEISKEGSYISESEQRYGLVKCPVLLQLLVESGEYQISHLTTQDSQTY